MLNVVMFGVIVGCFAAWLITLSMKRGWRDEWIATSPNKTLGELLSCNYCLSWWINAAVTCLVVIITANWTLLFSVFVGTMVSVKILE